MEEFLLILAVAVVLPLAILKMTLNYRRDRMRLEQERRPGESALTVAELKDLMRDVAEEANEPLVQRVEQLERLSTTDFGPAAEDEGVPNAERTMGRRVS